LRPQLSQISTELNQFFFTLTQSAFLMPHMVQTAAPIELSFELA
jgi:hypothetical protein